MDSFTYSVTLAVGILVGLVSIIAVAGGIYAIGVWHPRQVSKKISELKMNGKKGEATIVRLPEIRRYGSNKALYKVIQIGLEIRVPGIEEYEADKTFSIPYGTVRYLKIGKTVPVWIDADNPHDLAK